MQPWYVIYTAPSQEEFARCNLEDIGFEVFSPKVVKYNRAGEVLRVEALFPRYIFVSIPVDESWFEIVKTRGVQRLLGNVYGPTPLRDGALEAIQSQATHGCEYHVRPGPKFKPQEVIKVVEGPFHNLRGIYLTSAKDRVQILLTLFGVQRKVWVKEHQIGYP